MHQLTLRGVTVSLISLCISTILWLSGFITPFENRVWDERVKLLVDEDRTSDEIILILLDQGSLDWAEDEQGLPWPWPREVLTTIINFVSRGGAKSINFDVLYTEASLYGVSDDKVFGESIKNSGIFVGSTTLTEIETDSNTMDINNITIEGLEEWLEYSSMEEFPNITHTIPELWSNAQYLTNVNQQPDIDGIYRKGQLFYLLANKVIPSHALASYLVAQNSEVTMAINKDYFTVDDYRIPINERGEVILNYRGPSGAYRSYPAANIINSELTILSGETPNIDPEIFRDRYVYFGYQAPGLFDLRATPLSGSGAGVEIHAVMLDNLISRDFFRELSPFFVILITMFFSVTIGILFTYFQKIQFSLPITISGVLLPILLSIIFYNNNIWFPLIYMELTIILTLAGTGIMNFTTEGKQKRFIKSAFRQYLSPDVIEQILDDPGQLKLGGEKREISIFFSDLQGFTTISENLSPEGLTKFINEYLTAMTVIIQDEGGTIDKYEGDAIIAFWNAPITFKDHALRCVNAAIRCQKKLDELRPYFREMTGHDLQMRIGINTGDAVVGNLGSETRFDYTMLGDSVNLAARLEGLNKTFGSGTIISEFTREKISGIPIREIGRVRVVGKTQSITLYEPFLTEGNHTIFTKALKHFYNGEFNKALILFKELSAEDSVADKYSIIIKEFLDHPPSFWDGVINMTSK